MTDWSYWAEFVATSLEEQDMPMEIGEEALRELAERFKAGERTP